MVGYVLEDVEGDGCGVAKFRAAGVGLRAQEQEPGADYRVFTEPVAERGVSVLVGLGSSERNDRRHPLKGEIARTRTNLDRMLAEVRPGEVRQPAAIAPRVADYHGGLMR